MIPRTKVNYSAVELLRALLVREDGSTHRDALAARLRELFGFEHVLLTPSGRAAMYFLLRALPQPRVIVPAYTCKAVVEAARLADKEVVHVEVEAGGFNMDLGRFESRIDADSIVIATHQFGIPCNIEAIRGRCTARGAFLVEDAAAAFGTRVRGQLAGTFGDAAFFSFDSTKLINVPLKSGFLALRDPSLLKKVEAVYRSETAAMSFSRKTSLIFQGLIFLLIENPLLYRIFHTLMFALRDRFTADGPGLNLQLTPFYLEDVGEWQAFLAARQLRRLDAIIAHRREVYSAFNEQLGGCKGITLPPPDEHNEWACIRYPIRVHGDKLAFYRAANERGVDFAFSFTFIDCPDDMRHARELAASVLDLPYYAKLTPAEFNHTVRVLKDIAA